MKKSKYTDGQIVAALKEHESGISASDICRRLGISSATFYNWKKKFGGLGMTEMRKLKQLEEENRQLKTSVAELSLDKQILQDVIKKSSETEAPQGTCRGNQKGLCTFNAAFLFSDHVASECLLLSV